MTYPLKIVGKSFAVTVSSILFSVPSNSVLVKKKEPGALPKILSAHHFNMAHETSAMLKQDKPSVTIKGVLNTQYLNNLLISTLGKEIPGVVLAVSKEGEEFLGARGNIGPNSQFFIASATKLFITALILQLVDSKSLRFDQKLLSLLPAGLMTGLHVINDIDFTDQITIEHLLSHTSGLPDYFQATRKSKRSLMEQIFSGEDQRWNLNQVINDSKELGAVFPPISGKALYSDTNYQILGAIIENIFGSPLSEIIDKNICKRIHLGKTYLYQDDLDRRPVPLNYKSNFLNVPKAMTSFGPDGGIVSTASDGIQFLKAFFGGKLFNPSHITYMTAKWNDIFYPLKYGVGISLFRLPWYFSPFRKVPDLIGHSGLSGAFYFFCPAKNLFLAGTVNQLARPQTSFKLMVNVVLNA